MNLVNDMETIQNNNIMSITQANQTKKRCCIRIYDCQYFVYCNTAHFSLKLHRFYVLYCVVLYCVVLYRIVSCRAVPCRAVPYRIVLYYEVLY